MLLSFIVETVPDVSMLYSGSHLQYVPVDCGPPILHSMEGFIYSPNYPEIMPTQLQCEWRIDGAGYKAEYQPQCIE